MLHTKVDAQCDKLATDDRPPKLTTPVTVDVQLRHFLSPESGTKFLIFDYARIQV